MSLLASDTISHRNMSDLSHFGEHGQKFYSTSSMMSTGAKKRGVEDRLLVVGEPIFEAEKEMNCLDILAGVVSRCSSSEMEQGPLLCGIAEGRIEEACRSSADRNDSVYPQEHRVSCHRCGNIRKRKIVCERPQVYTLLPIRTNEPCVLFLWNVTQCFFKPVQTASYITIYFSSQVNSIALVPLPKSSFILLHSYFFLSFFLLQVSSYILWKMR